MDRVEVVEPSREEGKAQGKSADRRKGMGDRGSNKGAAAPLDVSVGRDNVDTRARVEAAVVADNFPSGAVLQP